MIQYLFAGLVGGAVALAQKPKKKGRRKYAEGGIVRIYRDSTFGDTIVYKEEKMGNHTIGIESHPFDDKKRHIFIHQGVKPHDGEYTPYNWKMTHPISEGSRTDRLYNKLKEILRREPSIEPWLAMKELERHYAKGGEVPHRRASVKKIMDGVRGSNGGPFTIIALDPFSKEYIHEHKFLEQRSRPYPEEIPLEVNAMRKKFPHSAIVVEDRGGHIIYKSYALGHERSFAKGGRVSTYEYEAGRNPKQPFDVIGRKDGMVMYHTTRESIKDSTDKAEELLENGYDEVLIGQP